MYIVLHKCLVFQSEVLSSNPNLVVIDGTEKVCSSNDAGLITKQKSSDFAIMLGGVRRTKTRYRVHRFDVSMRTDQGRFEQFLNTLEGEVISVIPNVSPSWTFGGMGARVYCFWVVEKVNQA